jgi:glutamate synthase domain-containing protein 2
MIESLQSFIIQFLLVTAALFIFAIGVFFLVLAVMYAADLLQTKHAIRRNFPLIGRFRYIFEDLGVFLRQYFFALDREEMPFNRQQRSYVYRAAKDEDTTLAFGSTRDLRPLGTVHFVNHAFPTLHRDAVDLSSVTIGPYSRTPYTTDSLFNISAMSYGAISKVAVEALSKGAARGGAWLNTGEGGLSPYHLSGGADIVFQIGTAKYGVCGEDGNLSENRLRAVADYDAVKMFEIKLSQGAKPGKGGILPGNKVTREIAEIRGIPEGKDSISPNRHTDIASNSELLDLIERVREITGKPTGFKCVVGDYGFLDELFDEIARRGAEYAPDFITIDSADGGTGAAPMSLMDWVGQPIQESLPAVVDRLNRSGLRERIKVIVAGKLITPADVAWALCMGADFVNSARGFMFALGCIQAMQCNKNTCPAGVTTHDPRLQKGLHVEEKAQRVANYIHHMKREVGIIAHSCGVPEARLLSRKHARIVTSDGTSKSLSEIYPEAKQLKAVADVAE